MAEKRKGKQKRKEDSLDKPTKEEYAVAKHLRFNLPLKEGKLVGMTVQYFTATKAVDMLMDSQWSSAKVKADALFTSRSSCVDYMHNLLEKGLFHRAARVEKKKDRDKKKRKGVKDSEVDDSGKEEDKKKKKGKRARAKEEEKKEEEKGKEEKTKEGKEDEEVKEKKDEEKKDEEKKKSKKDKKVPRLEMHELQIFKDADSEYYVWIYDPVPLRTFIIGLLLVLGAIAVCLFPLWPPEVRLGVYYLSLTAASFVGGILGLCVVRLILFCVVWGVTLGKHHFWFLPNLTEDVGFFDSFKPLYKHDVMEGNKEDASDKDKKKKEEESSEKAGKKEKEGKEEEQSGEEGKETGSEGDNENDQENDQENGENGYELIDKEELDDQGGPEEKDQGTEEEEEEERVEDVDEEDEENSQDSKETKKEK